MSLSPGIHALEPTNPQHDLILSQIVRLHATCIQYDHTMATFIPPLSYNHMYEHWTRLLAETTSQKRIILVHLSSSGAGSGSAPSENNSSSPAPQLPISDADLFQGLSSSPSPATGNDPTPELILIGTISLALPASETGPFRGLIGNLFVAPTHRRQGIARGLLAAIEKRALDAGRWNLMLDTTVGTGAEQVYPRLGWERLGVVKDYGISPKDGRLVDEVFYVKDLRGQDDIMSGRDESDLEINQR